MACHVRISADTAKFGQPEVGLGLIPGAGGTQRLQRLVGRGRALHLILSGETIDAAEALRISVHGSIGILLRAVRLGRRTREQAIVTLEGLGTSEKPHPVQKAFIDEQAAQCGYCINGMIMQAAALLQTNRKPTEQQIKAALADNLCRCGTHLRIVRAIKRASDAAA
jgi:enoyl-CoA hydratase/carnithine racemase